MIVQSGRPLSTFVYFLTDDKNQVYFILHKMTVGMKCVRNKANVYRAAQSQDAFHHPPTEFGTFQASNEAHPV